MFDAVNMSSKNLPNLDPFSDIDPLPNNQLLLSERIDVDKLKMNKLYVSDRAYDNDDSDVDFELVDHEGVQVTNRVFDDEDDE